MPLDPGDLMFVGWDSDNEDIAFVATVDIPPGEVIYFSDDEWDGTQFFGSEQLFEYTVPAGGIPMGTVVEIDMDPDANTVTFSSGGTVDYIQGGHQLAGGNEMFWAFQGTRVGDDVTPTNFIGVIANEADGNDNQTPNLSGTGLTTSNGAIIIDGDEDYMEYTADAGLPTPVIRDDLIASISDTSNWTTADGGGNNNPNGTGFDVVIPTIVCFTAGTLIETATGPRPIETLRPGDLVLTRDNGLQPLRWIGRRKTAARGRFAPVRIARGALGNTRDLLVSPQHRILITGWQAELLFGEAEILVPAIALLNDRTITQTPQDSVEYVHILFDRHEIVLAEGIPSESFFPGPNALSSLERAARSEVLALFPELETGAGPFRSTARPAVRVRDARALDFRKH